MAGNLNKLRKARKLKGLTQQELSRLTGIVRCQISYLERGKKSPNNSTKEKIEEVLGCRIDWISDGKAKTPSTESFRLVERHVKKLIEYTQLMPTEERTKIKQLVRKFF